MKDGKTVNCNGSEITGLIINLQYSQEMDGLLGYVCMYASNFLLFRSTLPDPKGGGRGSEGTNETHYRSGEGGSEAFTVWINVRFPLNI